MPRLSYLPPVKSLLDHDVNVVAVAVAVAVAQNIERLNGFVEPLK